MNDDSGKREQKIWIKTLNKKTDNREEMFAFLSEMPVHIKKYFPEHFFYLEKHNIVGMEYVDGRLFLNILLRAMFSKTIASRFNGMFFELGEFLRDFQKYYEAGRRNIRFFVDETIDCLERTRIFTEKEKTFLRIDLEASVKHFGKDEVRIAKLLNDFSPRNILLEESGAFKIVDVEALFHSGFPRDGAVWLDFLNFFLNLKNLESIVGVAVNSNRAIFSWGVHFFRGFYGDQVDKNKINALFNLFTLQLILGVIERPLQERYPGLRHKLFIRNVKKVVLQKRRWDIL